MGSRARHVPSESQTSGNYYLFTVEENDYLTIYKIKSYLSSPLSNIITNFKMTRTTIPRKARRMPQWSAECQVAFVS